MAVNHAAMNAASQHVNDERQYRVILLKAWTKDTLAEKISRELDPYPQEAIVSVQARVDFQFFVPWRRDWALIVLKRPETEPITA